MSALTCWLGGHQWLWTRAVGRTYLQCDRCGKESTGWGPAVEGWGDGLRPPRTIWRRPVPRKVRLFRRVRRSA